MIVRGAVLSEKRVPLQSSQPERAHTPAVRALSLANDTPAASSTTAAPAASLAPVQVSAPPAPPPLTIDSVSKWIAQQSEETRSVLALQLAEGIDRLKRAAYEQGHGAGLKAGEAEAAAAAASQLAALERITREAETTLRGECDALSAQCAEIVAAALTRIAGPLLTSPVASLGAVLEVLKRLTEEREIVVRVSAVDLPMLRESEERIAAALAGRKYSLVADTRVEAGGAIVESSLGSLDGRLEVQLRGLCDTVLAAKAAHRGPA